MNIAFETTWLAPGQHQAADRVRLNGRQLIDEGQFFRALYPSYFPRGNVEVNLEFTTHWQFNTTAAAEAFVLSHISQLPMTPTDNGVLQIICGAETSPQTIYSPSAVLEDVSIEYTGVGVDVTYKLRCQPFTTTQPSNTPAFTNPSSFAFVYQRGSNSIPSGNTTLAISFGTAFSSVPVVVASMAQQSGSEAVFCRILQNTVTTTGFTVEFSIPLPDSSSYVNWWAIQ